MTDADYLRVLEDAIQKLRGLALQQEEIELEANKLEQFIRATMNLLPQDARKKFDEQLAAINTFYTLATYSLTGAIRDALQKRYPDWLTVANVRDALVEMGFDFAGYKSNPLAAVSTTLRRLAADKSVEIAQVDGAVNAYRLSPGRKRTIKKI